MRHKYRFFRHLKMTHTVRALKKIMRKKEITGYELARGMNYDRSNVYKMLKGQRPIPIHKIPTIAEFLDIRPEYLVDAYVQDIRLGMYKYFEEIEDIDKEIDDV